MACASSAGVAACDAPCLAACAAPRLAACAAFATINAAATQRSGTAMPARSTARPGISIPMIQAPGSGSRAGATRDPLDAPMKPSHDKVAEVVVDKKALTVRALDANGKLISIYPASVGRETCPI